MLSLNYEALAVGLAVLWLNAGKFAHARETMPPPPPFCNPFLNCYLNLY